MTSGPPPSGGVLPYSQWETDVVCLQFGRRADAGEKLLHPRERGIVERVLGTTAALVNRDSLDHLECADLLLRSQEPATRAVGVR